jgi:hypothetical protein
MYPIIVSGNRAYPRRPQPAFPKALIGGTMNEKQGRKPWFRATPLLALVTTWKAKLRIEYRIVRGKIMV